MIEKSRRDPTAVRGTGFAVALNVFPALSFPPKIIAFRTDVQAKSA